MGTRQFESMDDVYEEVPEIDDSEFESWAAACQLEDVWQGQEAP